MKRIWLVLRYEIITIITRPSFLFAVFGVPLLGALVFAFASSVNRGSSAPSFLSQIITSPPQQVGEGYVDLSGVIQALPADLPPKALTAYPDETTASRALDAGEISAYYLIPADFLSTGKLTYINPEFNPISSSDQSDVIRWVLRVNLLGGDTQLASLVNGPLDVEALALAGAPQRDQDNPLTFFLPYAVTILFYVIILSTASLLLSSVTKEKENRVLEILMLSVSPLQMLAGKITALGLVGLLQTVLWVGTGRVLLGLSGTTFQIPIAFQLPVSFLVWGLVFFLLGYAVYASLMAGLGALAPNLREGSQATFIVILPLIIPMFFISVLIEAPHGAVAVAMSLFPLTSPVAMMTRLASGGVAWWHPPLAAVLLLATAALVIRSVAGMFRAQVLLTGQTFNVKVFLRALFGLA